MSQPLQGSPVPDPVSDSMSDMPQRHLALPSWLISAVLHLLVVLGLGLTLRLSPSGGAPVDRVAEVGIALKHQQGEEQYYETAEDAAGSDAASQSTSDAGVGQLLPDGPPFDPAVELPKPFDVIGPGALEQGGVGSAANATEGPAGNNRALGGKARTGVFGIEGEGYKFVYVFDRSASMGGPERDLLRRAKSELLGSLKSLEKTHQFQIIFYNDRIWKFNPTGDVHRLVWATERNKALAARHIGSVTAAGATDREPALMAAIRLQPDVIFFLTDADGPLGPGSLEKIRRAAAGAGVTSIHTIEFGIGSQMEPNNFLVQLARQNGGQHGYIDITRLLPTRRP